ncbi:DUF1501 domain-containing protein [Schlesneria paludicola]|uniref:DUF1501 domain-containing protein n=1 Tax=Schlesneria paludicola TaxID=360056 RepID=UPI00029AE79F|nr:DUF1501 domain-containing protein [Schlesneria paludicola]
MLSRRSFLKTSSLITLSPWVPSIFNRTALAAGPTKDAPVLVVIQMDGGNDGINTVVPYQDDAYARVRSKLRLKTDDLHKLSDQVALHHEMKAAAELFRDGRLSIVQGVGYPNPDRSHFTSMRIWESGYRDELRLSEDGWLGRALDMSVNTTSEIPAADAVHVGEQETPLALWGKRSTAISMKDSADLVLDLDALNTHPLVTTSNDATLRDFAARQVASTLHNADAFVRRSQSDNTKTAKYPDSKLASQLKLVSQLIQGNSPARVFYAIQSGYDTHSSQLNTHGRLLREFSTSLQAFLEDLRAAKLDDRVVVLAFSEFGRRVTENDSEGTDHGTAGPVFVAGMPVKGGLVGLTPSLTDLEDGDLRVQTDFRQVYASILEQWFKIPSHKILGGPFEGLELFQGA